MRFPLDALQWPRAESLRFGYRRTSTHRHQGVDFAERVGAPVYAAAAGVVAVVKRDPGDVETADGVPPSRWRGYGRVVVVNHGANGLGATLYAHLDTVAVHAGDDVAEGTLLGTVGRTRFDGDDPSSLTRHSHLHFEVLTRIPPRREEDRVDPERWYEAGGLVIPFRRWALLGRENRA